MIVVTLLGLLAGAGMWMVVAAVRPAPAPLARVLADLAAPPTPTVDSSAGFGPLARLTDSDSRRRELALAGIDPAQWARDKLVGTVGGLIVPLLVWAGLTAIGLTPPPAIALLALAAGAGGWMLPNLTLGDRVEERRVAFQHALSAYLDLVNVILAGGAGIETALTAAAAAGDGWAFAQIRQALERAQRVNDPLWSAFDRLGTDLGVTELRDLASTLQLAGSQGARIRASLAVKADTLRAHQIARTEADAEATTERMNVPTAVLLAGFLLFIVYPAVSAITSTQTSCVDSAACPTSPQLETP